jgi:hypothetical protein
VIVKPSLDYGGILVHWGLLQLGGRGVKGWKLKKLHLVLQCT